MTPSQLALDIRYNYNHTPFTWEGCVALVLHGGSVPRTFNVVAVVKDLTLHGPQPTHILTRLIEDAIRENPTCLT